MADITLLVPMPSRIHGCCCRKDGYDTALLNAKDTAARNLAAAVHEEEHIREDDFASNLPATVIECQRHEK